MDRCVTGLKLKSAEECLQPLTWFQQLFMKQLKTNALSSQTISVHVGDLSADIEEQLIEKINVLG